MDNTNSRIAEERLERLLEGFRMLEDLIVDQQQDEGEQPVCCDSGRKPCRDARQSSP